MTGIVESPPSGVIVLNRMGFGPRPGELEAFEALAPDDFGRIKVHAEQQLHPEEIPDGEVEERFRAAGFTTLNKTREQLWADHTQSPASLDWPTRIQPFRETERATFIRALYSRRQLAEVLADFWHNHFNIYAQDFWPGPLWVHYDRDIIRANMLGNFRKFLEDVATSLPMLMYLDNFGNTVAGPNENYARELFELHSLGAENYFGVHRQGEVPTDAQGRPVSYVDDDVYESTRAFTGWTVDMNTGKFFYAADQHDRFQKRVLGQFLRADQAPLKDGRDVLDAVAAHPGTARHIARKLCRRFIADDPPQRVVDEAAAVFMAQREAPDQLRQVVRTILLAPEFRTTWGQKVKRPFEFVVGCMRAVNAEMSFAFDDQASNHFLWMFAQTGQSLFQWPTPDGYPDVHAKWIRSNALVGSWKIVNWLHDVKNWWDHRYKPFDPFASMPAEVRSARAIADFWIQRILNRPLAPAARREIVEFTARGRDPEMELPNFDQELVRERVWGTLALIMMTPENHLR